MDNGSYIPRTAILVKVTNIIDPYHVRIFPIEGRAAKLDRLAGKLHQLSKLKLREYDDYFRPKIGDIVLIENGINLDLPAWCCRGIVGSTETSRATYKVFLPDHGIALELCARELKILPPNSISEDYLTSAVGIGDVLPITRVNGIICVSELWNENAVKFIREIASASTRVYFDHLMSDKFGNKFGELYFVLENEIVIMTKELICNRYAIPISHGVTEIIEHSEKSDRTKTIEVMICDTRNSAKPNEIICNKLQSKSTAVYPRAFNGSIKRNQKSVYDHEILICSDTQCGQLDSIEEAGFPTKIHKALRSMSFTRPMQLQSYVWPAVTKGLNVVAINAPKSGKTCSYLVPIVGSIAANEIYPKVKKINGPLALILCVCSLDVYHVNEKCEMLLRDYPQIKVVPAYNGVSEKGLTVELYNGCEIIISTPPYLARLIKSNRKLLNFERLAHVVFDGADVILDKYKDSLGSILKILKNTQDERKESSGISPMQIITVGRYWTPSMRKLVDGFIEDPYVCIGSYMEAAVCAASKPKFLIVSKDQKAGKVAELLGNRWSLFKTIIMCTTTEEAKELSEFLRSRSIDILVAHNEMIFTDIQAVKENWMARVSGEYRVLICIDQVLSDLKIRDADWLIHYSVASGTKTQFFYRFSTLANNFYRRLCEKEKPKPGFVLMADESNDAQLNGIMTMLRRLEVKMSPTMESYLENVILSMEMTKTDRCLCENIKAFGRCANKDTCRGRHCLIPEIDRPKTNIRNGDNVKLVITRIHSANHYSARMVEYTKADTNERVVFPFMELTELTVRMQNHYANPSNRRLIKTVNVGEVCAIERAPGDFKRLQILSAIDIDGPKIQDVDVRCIDDGDILSVKVCQLLEIPDDLSQWPSHFVDVYLTGIVPYDGESSWSPCADEIAYKWFMHYTTDSMSSVFGKVNLHLSHIIWVDPLEVKLKLNGYPNIIISSLVSDLIEAKCAVKNKEHVENLLELCRVSKSL